MTAMMITTDGRGRATLGPKNQTYRATELEDGALMLEPARVLTETEIRVLSTPGMVEAINTSLADPEAAQAAPRRSRRA